LRKRRQLLKAEGLPLVFGIQTVVIQVEAVLNNLTKCRVTKHGPGELEILILGTTFRKKMTNPTSTPMSKTNTSLKPKTGINPTKSCNRICSREIRIRFKGIILWVPDLEHQLKTTRGRPTSSRGYSRAHLP